MINNFKILSTGNIHNGGICLALSKVFPDIEFVSRTNGFDLSKEEGIKKFKSIITNYNVFINHSQIALDNKGNKLIGAQENLLNIAREAWTVGHVITIGSILEFAQWDFLDPVVGEEKRQLRERSLELNSEKFKTTHLIVSGFDRHYPLEENEIKINPDKIAQTIKFILESELDFPLLYVDKTNDDRIKKWKTIRDNFNNL